MYRKVPLPPIPDMYQPNVESRYQWISKCKQRFKKLNKNVNLSLVGLKQFQGFKVHRAIYKDRKAAGVRSSTNTTDLNQQNHHVVLECSTHNNRSFFVVYDTAFHLLCISVQEQAETVTQRYCILT